MNKKDSIATERGSLNPGTSIQTRKSVLTKESQQSSNLSIPLLPIKPVSYKEFKDDSIETAHRLNGRKLTEKDEILKDLDIIYSSHKSVYSRCRVPSSLKLAKLHWDCSIIGQIPKKWDVRNFCCFSLEQKKKRFPWKQNPIKIKGNGSTVPLYFQFTEYCAVCCLLAGLGFLKAGWDLSLLYHDWSQSKSFVSHTPLSFLSRFLAYSFDFYFGNLDSIIKIYLSNLPILTFFNIILHCYAVFFSIVRQRLINRVRGEEHDTAATYTIMVKNVSDDARFEDFEVFFQEITEDENFETNFQIEKYNLSDRKIQPRDLCWERQTLPNHEKRAQKGDSDF